MSKEGSTDILEYIIITMKAVAGLEMHKCYKSLPTHQVHPKMLWETTEEITVTLALFLMSYK